MKVLRELSGTLLLSYRMDGLGPTARRIWERLFGIRYLESPREPVELPATVNGIIVRQMSEADIDAVARSAPFELGRQSLKARCARLRECLPEAFVALREGRIVGASWYADGAKPDKPWFEIVADKLVPPSRLTAGIFSVPGEKAAAWALSRYASAWLAARGIRTVIGFIRAENRPSLVLSRVLGGRIVACQSVRYCLGVPVVRVKPAADTDAFGGRPAPGPDAARQPKAREKDPPGCAKGPAPA